MLSVLALFLSAAAASAGTIPINGLVVNKGKEPMVGVTVLLKGTSRRALRPMLRAVSSSMSPTRKAF